MSHTQIFVGVNFYVKEIIGLEYSNAAMEVSISLNVSNSFKLKQKIE
jgi:hypothetical protein